MIDDDRVGRILNAVLGAAWDDSQLAALAGSMSRYEFVLRFTLSHAACHTTIVGTTALAHLQANVAAAKAGPLPSEVYREAIDRLARNGEQPVSDL